MYSSSPLSNYIYLTLCYLKSINPQWLSAAVRLWTNEGNQFAFVNRTVRYHYEIELINPHQSKKLLFLFDFVVTIEDLLMLALMQQIILLLCVLL